MTTIAMPKPHRDRGIEGHSAKWYAANSGEMMKEFIISRTAYRVKSSGQALFSPPRIYLTYHQRLSLAIRMQIISCGPLTCL